MRLVPVPPSGAPGTARGATAIATTRLLDKGDAAAGARLLDLLPGGGGSLAWVRGDDGLVGWGEAARAEFTGPERFSRAMSWWHDWLAGTRISDPVGVPGSGPVAFGSFAFDHTPGTSLVVVPRVVVGRRAGTTWITGIDCDPQLPPRIPVRPPRTVRWDQGTASEQEWGAAVRRIVDRIEAGELDKVVLARDLVARIAGTVDERFIMEQLHLDYPQCWTFHVGGLVGATPELLVRRVGTGVMSRVLAGTVRRSGGSGGASDDEAAAALLDSDKDLNEHAYAVASVADALAAHCTDLTVPARPQVLRLANVQHLATDVTGTLADGASALALAASLHPTAAVCGTPTERARTIIRDCEAMDRGRYAGPVGWFDSSGDGEFGIALRCGQIERSGHGSSVRIFAGCGLVAGSTPQAELEESRAKFAAMRSALSVSAERPANRH